VLQYAGYYTAFASTAVVIYLLRTRKGYRSLPEAINERYGSLATVSFGLAVLFRLFQEVWSNALVVGGFYGLPVRFFNNSLRS
jgi:SSS family solute:Na+ symporter